MKRLLLAMVVLFGVHTSFATSIEATAILLNMSFTPSGGFMSFVLAGGRPGQKHFSHFTGVDVLSLTCANATCTRFNSDIVLSGFSDAFGPTSQPVLGSLTFTSTRFNVQVNGTLTFCLTAPCSPDELLTLDVHTHGFPTIVATNTNGSLSLVSARDVVPEPSSLALCGTGFAFLVGMVRKRLLFM